jgi:penicillin amidase
MKTFKRILLALLVLILILAAVVYFWMRSTAPNYSGKEHLEGLKAKTTVEYDSYGVPHIVAQNTHDAYFTFGYVHAQDRLFQMIMIRRVVEGRLAEILGKDLLKTDKYMRVLSLEKMAEQSARRFRQEADEPVKQEVEAYVEGVNAFMKEGTLPIEFTLMGFKPEKFTVTDVFRIINYMSLSFTAALSEDPLYYRIYEKYGDAYLKDLDADSATVSQHRNAPKSVLLASLFKTVQPLQKWIPIPIWEGSNNWVISKERSQSGKVLLANDTHIKYSQPAVWYEADIRYPGFHLYGYYLAGIPFALVGHNDYYAWGLTIFPFDNMDLYSEKQNPENPQQYQHAGDWLNYKVVHDTIPVKGSKAVPFDIRYTLHGPLLNTVLSTITAKKNVPVSLWWAPMHFKTTSIEALYLINNATDLKSFRKGVSLVDVVGLNVVYGDKDDNIAWWAAGRIPIHPAGVNPRLILDGASGKADITGYYPFEKNPQAVNPPEGILNTSNNAPPPVDGIVYPGYYFHGYRAARIKKLLLSRPKWSLKEMEKIQLDVHSDRDLRLTNLILTHLGNYKGDPKIVAALQNWDGNYDTASTGAVVYTQLLYFVLRDALQDEVGEKDFHKLMGSFMLRGSIEHLLTDKNSVWWDNIKTKAVETRTDIFKRAFSEATVALKSNMGSDMSQWKWGRVHQLTHVHPIGKKPPFDKYLNVGPFPVQGGNEVIDKEGFVYNEKGIYPVISGPALRFLIDFGDTDHALSVIPTGQSGNVFSPHYADQAKMFVHGKYRTQIMLLREIKKGKVLTLLPESSGDEAKTAR